MSRKYTAQEMRDMADYREAWGDKDCVNDMLRQAADMMEQEDKRAREFEYIVRFFRHGKCVDRYSGHYDTIDEAKLNNTFCMRGDVRKIFRRSVGNWEEVMDGKDKRPDIDSDAVHIKESSIGLGIHITQEDIKKKRSPDDAVFSNVLVGEWEKVPNEEG